MMDSHWLEKFIHFRHSPLGLSTGIFLVSQKIQQQNALLSKYHQKQDPRRIIAEIEKTVFLQKLFIYEAQFAKQYWQYINILIKNKLHHFHRKPRNAEPGNKLLDIGYHWLRTSIGTQGVKISLPFSIGLLHKASHAKSQPLLYDLMDPWRPICVDIVFATFIRQKKQGVSGISSKMIAHFVHQLKQNFQRVYYFPPQKRCITLEYWIYLYLEHFYHCVNKKIPFLFPFPSWRHEDRCNIDKSI